MSFTYFNTMCFYNRFNLFNLCVQPCLFHTMFKAWLICFYMSSIHTQPASSYWFNPSRTAPVSLPPQVLFPRRPGWAMSTRTFNALVEPPGGGGRRVLPQLSMPPTIAHPFESSWNVLCLLCLFFSGKNAHVHCNVLLMRDPVIGLRISKTLQCTCAFFQKKTITTNTKRLMKTRRGGQ